jgi:hypothetical protein
VLTLRWEDPPPPARTPRTSWAPRAEAMREHPRRWLRLTERKSTNAATTFVNEINKGLLRAFEPAGDFEARCCGAVVYARYLGAGELEEEAAG